MPENQLANIDARDLIELAASSCSAIADRIVETRRELDALESTLRELASRFGWAPVAFEGFDTEPSRGEEDGTPERGA